PGPHGHADPGRCGEAGPARAGAALAGGAARDTAADRSGPARAVPGPARRLRLACRLGRTRAPPRRLSHCGRISALGRIPFRGARMSVSVVVPSTLTNPACGRALDSVVRAVAAVDDGEVLVVANGAGPRRCPPALAQPSVRVLECSRTGPSAARNAGLAAARHSVVLFTDDDCVVPPTWCTD